MKALLRSIALVIVFPLVGHPLRTFAPLKSAYNRRLQLVQHPLVESKVPFLKE
jgi:hypothetical protein